MDDYFLQPEPPEYDPEQVPNNNPSTWKKYWTRIKEGPWWIASVAAHLAAVGYMLSIINKDFPKDISPQKPSEIEIIAEPAPLTNENQRIENIVIPK